MTAKELREKRAALVPEMRALTDKANDAEQEFAGEDEERWRKINADYDTLTRQIEMAERLEHVDADQTAPVADPKVGRDDLDNGTPEDRDDADEDDDDGPPAATMRGADASPEDRALAFQAWARVQAERPITNRHRKAAERVGLNLNYTSLRLKLLTRSELRRMRGAERRAAMSTSDGTGGETIPEGFVSNFETALLAYGGVRKVATVLRTDKGNALPWPTTNDTGNKGALIAESTADAEQNVATSSITLNAYKYTSKIIKVPAELLEDSAFDLVSFCGERCGERVGRITADHFTTGTGSAQPNGIVTASTAGKTAASATAIAANELIELLHSVDPAYRGQPGFGWMFHDNVLLYIRKLKDDDGQYLWQPGMRADVPDTLYGYPYTINQSMASSIAASAKTVLVGLLKKYIVRDVRSLRLKHLKERYAEYDQEAFIAYSRHDGELLDAGTHPVKHLIQKSS